MSLAFVRRIHRWSVVSPHKGPVTPKKFPLDDVIMWPPFVVCCWGTIIDSNVTQVSNGRLYWRFLGNSLLTLDMINFQKKYRYVFTVSIIPPHWYDTDSWKPPSHYGDVIMGTIASQITSLTIVYSTVYSRADQRKHQSSASLAFVRGIHRGPVNSPHKWASNAENVSIWWRHHDVRQGPTYCT